MRYQDGLAVIEDLCGLRIESCMPPDSPYPHPGKCRKGGYGDSEPTSTGKTVKKRAASAGKKKPDALKKKIPAKTAAARAKGMSAKDMFKRETAGTGPERVSPEVLETLKGAYNVTHGGLRSDVTSAGHLGGSVVVNGKIFDSNNEQVGTFIRHINQDPDGTPWVDHELLQMSQDVQGQGFAQALNDQAFSWYENSGIDRVELFANVDRGPYAWARAGYDWRNPNALDVITGRVREEAARGGEEGAQAQVILNRLETVPFGDPGFPTPFEISELGRPPGGGKGQTWAGKRILRSAQKRSDPDFLGYAAVRKVKQRAEAVTAAAQRKGGKYIPAAAERDQVMIALAELHDSWVKTALAKTKFVAQDSPDFNQYYVDYDAPGGAQDELAAGVRKLLKRG